MKKLFLLTILLLALLACSKQAQPTRLDVVITQHPVGGFNVSALTTTISGTMSGDIKPVNVTLEWWWENGLHMGQKMLSSSTYAFITAKATIYTSTWNSQAGYYHLNYFWAKIRWTDDLGVHELETQKAYCN